MQLPDTLDFRITSQCNMHCSFCFGTTIDGEVSTEKLLPFFLFLRKNGVKNVVLTGGEPSLAKNFSETIFILKDLGYRIALSTNGSFWLNSEIKKIVLRECEWIAFPIESAYPQIHNHMRSPNHYEMIYLILSQIKEIAPNIKIKIGTVVTQENLKTIPNILDVIPVEPESWKLFQLVKAKNVCFYNQQSVSDEDFDSLINNVTEKYKHLSTSIVGMHESDRDGRYLFLEPDGSLIGIFNNKECFIGNCFGDRDEIIDMRSRIAKYVNVIAANTNFYNSFTIK